MKSVLFVCLGNICRSPMAEGILRHKAEQQGLKLKIDSAGTGNWHAGQHPDLRAISTAQAHGIDISKLVARQITENDLEEFDFIYVADAAIYDGVVDIALDREQKLKVDYIMNLVHPDLNMPVPDPYYGGADGFENVYQMLNKACDVLVQQIAITK